MPSVQRRTSFIPVNSIRISNLFSNNDRETTASASIASKRVGRFIDASHEKFATLMGDEPAMKWLFEITGGSSSNHIITKDGLSNLCEYVDQGNDLPEGVTGKALACLVFDVYDPKEIRRSGTNAYLTELRSWLSDNEQHGIAITEKTVIVDYKTTRRLCASGDTLDVLKQLNGTDGLRYRSVQIGNIRANDYVCIITAVSGDSKTVTVFGSTVIVHPRLYEQYTAEARFMMALQEERNANVFYSRHAWGFLPDNKGEFKCNQLMALMYQINNLIFKEEVDGPRQFYHYRECMPSYVVSDSKFEYGKLLDTINKVAEFYVLHYAGLGGSCGCGMKGKPVTEGKLRSQVAAHASGLTVFDEFVALKDAQQETEAEKQIELEKKTEYSDYQDYKSLQVGGNNIKGQPKKELDDNVDRMSTTSSSGSVHEEVQLAPATSSTSTFKRSLKNKGKRLL